MQFQKILSNRYITAWQSSFVSFFSKIVCFQLYGSKYRWTKRNQNSSFRKPCLQRLKHHQETCSESSLSVFSVKNPTQLSTALPEHYCHPTGKKKKPKKKGCIKTHTNYEKYENLLVSNPILIVWDYKASEEVT